MSNAIIPIPNYHPDEIAILLNIDIVSIDKDEVLDTQEKVYYPQWQNTKHSAYTSVNLRKANANLTKFYSQFSQIRYREYFVGHGNNRMNKKVEIIKDSVGLLLHLRKTKTKLLWNKFFSEPKKKKHEFKIFDVLHYSTGKQQKVYFVANYITVKESIISYMQQSDIDSEDIALIRELFAHKNNLEYDEYLEEKTKYLLSLDLDENLRLMNEEIDKKLNPVEKK